MAFNKISYERKIFKGLIGEMAKVTMIIKRMAMIVTLLSKYHLDLNSSGCAPNRNRLSVQKEEATKGRKMAT